MIKLPKEINRVIKAGEEKGIAIYAAGICVRETLLGRQPLDWDLLADAEPQRLKELFPEAKQLQTQTLRIVFPAEAEELAIVADIMAVSPSDIGSWLKNGHFSIDAIADNPARGIIDPFGGREALKQRLICAVGDPGELFKEHPEAMLYAVKLAAQLNFDLHKSIFDAICENRHELESVDKAVIREAFTEILSAEHAGKGLGMLAGTELLTQIAGSGVTSKMSRREIDNFDGLVAGIDKTMQVPERRLGLFYSCFSTKKAAEAIRRLEFEGELLEHLEDALYLTETMHFMVNKYDIKEFLVKYGEDRYNYLHNLAKAQRIIYDLTEVKIMSRHYLMQEIINNGEPIYVEDLAIDANDLMEAGIAQAEKAQQLLVMLTDVVHRKPNENTRQDLLKYAAKFAKNKPAATLRKVKWLK